PSCFGPAVNALALDNHQLIVGGTFTTAGNQPAENLGQWDTTVAIPTPTPCATKPSKPKLAYPRNGEVQVSPLSMGLGWKYSPCASSYNVTLKQGSQHGKLIESATGILTSGYATIQLKHHTTYYWQIQACNEHGCASSKWRYFGMD